MKKKLADFLKYRKARRILLDSGYFDTAYYLERYPDVAISGISPVDHYLKYGATEGRNPSLKFDTAFYLDANPDVRAAGINPLLHFLQSGIHENRAPLPGQVPQSATFPSNNPQQNDSHIIHIDYTIKVVYPATLQSQLINSSGSNELINTFFDEIYIINLKKREDRLTRMLHKTNGLNLRVRIVEAMDGNELPHRYEYLQYAKIPAGAQNAPPSERASGIRSIAGPEAWGLLKTWRMIFRDAMSKNYQRILVLEDDIVFIQDFHTAFQAYIETIGERSWKVLTLGVNPNKWDAGTFALGIHQSAFSMLKEEMEKMIQPAGCVFRQFFTDHPQQCLVAQPNLIFSETEESDIEQSTLACKDVLNTSQKREQSRFGFTRETELVSVIMPAFNAEKTIEISLKSLLRQTWPSLEIIVVDDCSTDKTGEIVKSLARQDPRIRYYRLETHSGAYVARNRAIRQSTGKYIANMDADDVALSTRIEKQLIPILMGQARFTVAHMIRSFCPAETLTSEVDHELLLVAGSFLPADKANDEKAVLRPRLCLASFLAEKALFEKHGLYIEEFFSADAELIERILYYEKGLRITEMDTGVLNYLVTHPQIDRLFSLLTDVLYLSTNRTENNLTRQYPPQSSLRKAFQERWRSDFDKNQIRHYPVLNS